MRDTNLYADLSAGSGLKALRRDVKHTHVFLETYADRLLFGRDYYGGESLEFLRSLELSQSVREKIFHENALKLVPSTGEETRAAPRLSLG